MRAASLAALFLSSIFTACSTPTSTPSPETLANSRRGDPSGSALPAGIVATVGSLAIPEEAIIAVTKTQQIPPRQAIDAEVRDALFAAAALGRGYEDALDVRAALRGRLARARLEALRQQAASAPVTDAEVQDATSRHFVDLDRPEAFRVIHAVVRVTEKADPAERAKAKALAERIAERVASAGNADEFKSQAESIEDRAGFELRVESLKPVAADGRVVDVDHPSTGENYTRAFARAAARLTQSGQKSGVVPTEFGFHVMMLVERTAPFAVPLEERRRILHDEIITERVKSMKKELVDELRSGSPPVVERAADALIASVIVDEHEAP